LICGDGADAFARECGFPEHANALLVTKRQRARWEELHALAKKHGGDAVRAGKIGTIGAVAVDAKGHVAACTSTGGTPYKRPGRRAPPAAPATPRAWPARWPAARCPRLSRRFDRASLDLANELLDPPAHLAGIARLRATAMTGKDEAEAEVEEAFQAADLFL